MEQVSVSPSSQALVFIRELEREIMACEAVRHPFLARFASEPPTIEQIRAFGLQHYQLVKVFTTYIRSHLALPRDSDFRVGLGAVGPGHEFSIPTMFQSLIAGQREMRSNV